MPHCGNYEGLNYDDEGLYSITHSNDADIISKIIIDIINTIDINIIDLTSGCGGNIISFCKFFKQVTGVEINQDRFKILEGNLKKYNYSNYNLICDDCNNLNYNNYDVFFIDPPWGGPDYKNNTNIELYLSDCNIKEFIKKLPKNKLIVLKVPFNYNINYFTENLIQSIKIKNMIILFININ